MEKKKIVYIAQSAGGVAEYLYMLLKNMENEESENILIVSQDYKDQIKRFEPYVKEIFIVPMVRNIALKLDLNAIFKIKKIIKKIKPDIVYLHSSKAGALGRIALWFNFKKPKILYNAHGWYFNADIGKKKQFFFSLIEKILAYKTDVIINISNNEYVSAIKNKIAPSKKMCVIDNGIEFGKFCNLDEKRKKTRKLFSINEREILIGVVGRISEQKDPMTMIKAFSCVCQKYSNVKMMFVGAGDEEGAIKEYIVNKGLEKKVIITGWTNKVEDYIPAFDIAILPSKWEGFGLAIIEYMVCDKPIIASDVGGISDIIENEKNGLLIKKGDYIDLSKKIMYLIENKNAVNAIIKNNQQHRNYYSIQRVAEDHKKILKI